MRLFRLLPLLCLSASLAADRAPERADFLRILQRFPRYAEKGWHNDPRDLGVGWFGDGRSDENGQRTMGNFILTYAWLANQPDYDPHVSGVPRTVVAGHAIMALRYMARTHVTGDLTCQDGKPWGNHWQSAWWTSKMMGGARQLWTSLDPGLKERLKNVVVHEADRHLTAQPRFETYGNTRSEENAWDSEVLAWAINLYPDHPHVEGWRRAFRMLCLNTLSVAADTREARKVHGRSLKEWIPGANVHDDWTIENHGFFHICYMACPLHSLAWGYYVFKLFGNEPDPVLFHHVPEVWARLKQFWLWDNRFAYAGGKDWPRYAYGMYFILPALVALQQVYGDADARLIEARRVAAFETEQLLWDNGSFFGGRFTLGRMERWPAEWETDCAANLTIACLLHEVGRSWPKPGDPADLARRNVGTFISPESELLVRRDPQRYASWCWRPYRAVATGLVCSDIGEHMLEWDGNLVGALRLQGLTDAPRVWRHRDVDLGGGFATVGLIGLGVDKSRSSPYRLEVRDDNIPTANIKRPEHPLFSQPNNIEALPGQVDLDSLTAAGPAWTVLATNRQGGPSYLEATPGRGKFILSMTNVDELCAKGDPTATALLRNVLDYLEANGARIGYIAGEAHVRAALDALGVRYSPVTLRGAPDFAAYDVIFVDRTATRLAGYYPELLAFVAAGGRVFHSVVQDKDWEPNTIVEQPSFAVRQQLACVALPDGRTTIVARQLLADSPVTVQSLDLLGWRLANDFMNGFRRTLATSDPDRARVTLKGVTGTGSTDTLTGRWLNVDEDLGLVLEPAVRLTIGDTPRRQAAQASLCYATLSAAPAEAVTTVAAGRVIGRLAVIFRTRQTPAETATLAAALPPAEWSPDGVRLSVPGADGRRYRVALDYRTLSCAVTSAAGE